MVCVDTSERIVPLGLVGLAYNRNMKRLAFSVLGGLAIPFLYSIIVGPLTPYVKNETMNQLASLPVRWPILILQRILPLGSFPFRDGDGTFLLLYVFVCDVILYTILTYAFLWGSSRRKSQQLGLPPIPPFVQH